MTCAVQTFGSQEKNQLELAEKKKEDIFLQHVKDVRIPQGPQGRMSQGLWGRGESQEQEDSPHCLLCLSVCLCV